ncbi:transmembrane protein [Flavobacterium rivuli WB 3.3-2 = DSM 21788]|uniref:Transmembrane protein n=1 Tax=Flavobacterium rivuli WB 3.3-2 = DSM 21788 TaxID=1121895 RepID=A0A0A2M5K3_9FLAO|nr:PepSY-associated TM helix domain-containing protein [Flavobacterium rivuli]KGO87947.1 transmembrane protein [Flavobacterium rivuli WB 3.3-2 = DSM 21788]
MTKKKKKKDVKHWVGKAHLWLGLTSGLVVLLLAVTGCIYVFSVEITAWLRHDEMYVKEVKQEKLPMTFLWEQTQKAVGPGKKITSAQAYNDPEKAVVFTCYKAGNADAILYFNSLDQYYNIYTDPYTGKVLGIYDEELDFFNIVKMLHWSLLLNAPVGQQIIGWSTFIFVVMLITGIILWWPKNKAARKQRLWFQWKDTTKWRRKNYDLHNILGFYAATIALIIAFTGMVWAFTWFQSLVYVAGSLSVTPPKELAAQSKIAKTSNKDLAFNNALTAAMSMHKDAAGFSISKPADSIAAIDIYVGQYPDVYYVSHQMKFDQYTGKLLAEKKHDEKNFGEKLITANYDIHVGAILGLPGKILAFIASFICGLLPISGFLIWYGRTYKKGKA